MGICPWSGLSTHHVTRGYLHRPGTFRVPRNPPSTVSPTLQRQYRQKNWNYRETNAATKCSTSTPYPNPSTAEHWSFTISLGGHTCIKSRKVARQLPWHPRYLLRKKGVRHWWHIYIDQISKNERWSWSNSCCIKGVKTNHLKANLKTSQKFGLIFKLSSKKTASAAVWLFLSTPVDASTVFIRDYSHCFWNTNEEN